MENKVVVVGDLMLDIFKYGEINRVNPEAPGATLINILEEETEYKLGGAGNLAANLAGLGNDTVLIGNIGENSDNSKISTLCEKYGIEFLEVLTNQPTIEKTRIIEKSLNQQVIRIDSEKRIELEQSKISNIIDSISKLNPKLIVVSDYNKGFVNKELISKICSLGGKILVDTKPSQLQYYNNIFLLKPNFKEFVEMIGEKIENTDENIENYGRILSEKLGCNLVVTRSEKGASIIPTHGDILHIPTKAKEIRDVTGAGDTFLAGLVTGINMGMELENAVILGNEASGIAVSRKGTTVINKEELFTK